jgi:8-oxo-dGTP pyrophosphatase MutT (NUDIX family)
MTNYQIFYKKHILAICTTVQHVTPDILKNCFILHQNYVTQENISGFLTDKKHVVIVCQDAATAEKVFVDFQKYFLPQQAAGGLVLKDNHILTIFKRYVWDFPKGHLEEGESDTCAALREVEEETGIDHLFITDDLGYMYHIYQETADSAFVFKTTHWFAMRTTSLKQPVPQIEETISKVQWIPLTEIMTMTMYLSMKHLLSRFMDNCDLL